MRMYKKWFRRDKSTIKQNVNLKQFDLDLWIREILDAAKKRGLSPEMMEKLKHNAEMTKLRCKLDAIRLEKDC